MSVTKKRVFNLILAGLMIAAPALAAESSKEDDKRPLANKRLECADGACKESKSRFSDEQIEKMISLKNQFLDNTATKRAELETLQRQLKDMFRAENIDRQKAMDLQSKVDAIRADLSKSRLNLKLDQIAILTPEQRQDMRHKMLRGGGFGRGHHNFGGHGPRHFGNGPAGDSKIGSKPQSKA